MLLCYCKKNMQEHWKPWLRIPCLTHFSIWCLSLLICRMGCLDYYIKEFPSAIKLYVYVCFIYFINEETTNRDESFVQSYTATKWQCQHREKIKKSLFHNRVCPFNCCATFVLFTKRRQDRYSEKSSREKASTYLNNSQRFDYYLRG